MGEAVYIVLEDGSAPALDGKSLGQHVELLDQEAEALGCTPLLDFFAAGEQEDELVSDLEVDLGIELELPNARPWFDPGAGLATVRCYLSLLSELPLTRSEVEGIELDLRGLESALELAAQSGCGWHLASDL